MRSSVIVLFFLGLSYGATTFDDSVAFKKNISVDSSITTSVIKFRNSRAPTLIYTNFRPDTMQSDVDAKGITEPLDSTFEAFKFTATNNINIYAFGLQFKKAGPPITNVNSLIICYMCADNAGKPGARLTAIDAAIMPTYITNSFLEYYFYTGYIVLTAGSSYWIVVNTYIPPTGGTVNLNTGTIGTALYAESTSGTWTLQDNKCGWYRLYFNTPTLGIAGFTGSITAYTSCGLQSFNGVSTNGGPNTCIYRATATKGANCFEGYSGHGKVLKASTGDGFAVFCTTYFNGTGVYSVAPGSNGVAGKFIGGIDGGHGIEVQKGIKTDSIAVNEIKSNDSIGPPTSVEGLMTIGRYFGTDGDTVLTTPNSWMHIKMKGPGGVYQDYKLPLYK